MRPAIPFQTTSLVTDLFQFILSIVNGYHDRLTDMESLIGSRLDDQFDSEETDASGEIRDDLSSDEA